MAPEAAEAFLAAWLTPNRPSVTLAYTDGMCKEVQLDLILEVGGDANINLVIDPHAIIATRKWVIDYLGQWKDLWNNYLKDFNNPHKTTIDLIPGLRDELNKFIKSDVNTLNNTFVINLMKKIRVPVWLERDTDWYVDGLNGSDQNDGLTPATAFKTIQYAVNYVSENFNLGPYTGAINLLSLTFTEDVWLPKYQASTGKMVIAGPASDNRTTVKGAFYAASGTGYWRLKNIKVQYDGRSSPDTPLYFAVRVGAGARVDLINVTIDGGTSGSQKRIGVAAGSGSVVIYDNCSFTGQGVYSFLTSSGGGTILVFGDMTTNGSVTGGTVVAESCGSLALDGTFLGRAPRVTGTITGTRASAFLNGVINSGGSGGSAAFPGTVTVTTPPTGGQII